MCASYFCHVCVCVSYFCRACVYVRSLHYTLSHSRNLLPWNTCIIFSQQEYQVQQAPPHLPTPMELTVGPHSRTPILMQRITHTHNSMQKHMGSEWKSGEATERKTHCAQDSFGSWSLTQVTDDYTGQFWLWILTRVTDDYIVVRVGEGRRGGKTTLLTVLVMVTDSGHDDYSGVGGREGGKKKKERETIVLWTVLVLVTG